MRSSLIFLILFILLTACTPARRPLIPWQISDLRLLEIPDKTDTSNDLIALYTRQINNDFQIRLDMMDFQSDFNSNLYILLDTSSSDNRFKFPFLPPAISSVTSNQGWDMFISLPDNGIPQTFLSGNIHSKPNHTPRIQIDPLLDTIVVSLNRNLIPVPENLTFQIFITTPDGKILLDKSPPISNNLSSTRHFAPLIIAFSDSFPAFTPAQSIRYWDGAHTGPNGERHGLKHILDNAEKFNIPVVLLDLKIPTSLSGLDFIDALPMVKNMERHNLLLLPDVGTSNHEFISLYPHQGTASAFGLPASSFFYSTDGHLQSDYRLQFVDLPDRSHLLQNADSTLIPLPDLAQNNVPIQVTNDGLSLEVRRQLLHTALSSDPADLVVLGGSLPYSTWGDSDMSFAGMAYIAAHPWIQPLDANQLRSFITQPIQKELELPFFSLPAFPVFNSEGDLTQLDSTQLQEKLLENLQISPKNTVADLAWQMFFTLTEPSTSTDILQLRYQYLNQVESLLSASSWLESKAIISDCNQDIDLDSQNECILSNSRFFAIIELDGGRISFLFERDGDQLHQLVGPLSQLFVGLSDPSQWNFERGPAADPAEIPGAFSDSDNPFMNYKISDLSDGLLILDRSDGQMTKIFRLVDNGLSVDVNSSSTVEIQIPLVVDPQLRFRPGWKDFYSSQTSLGSYRWSVLGDISVVINSTANLSAQDFIESVSLLNEPENPDLNYPPGHFLPFPLALIEISGKGPITVDILVQN